jgi:hypothetical protein
MNIKRMRGRNNRSGGGGGNFRSQQSGVPLNRNHVFDSNGPEQRVRGTAQQLHEKYQQMGRDATTSGDRVMAESYFQYAEHYFRIIAAINQTQSQHSGSQHTSHGGQNQGHNQSQNAYQNGNGQQANGRRDDQTESNEQDEGEEIAGMGDQPGLESREIPIAAAPPES